MCSARSRRLLQIFTVCFSMCLSLCCASFAWAQSAVGGSGETPQSDTSRTPFRIKLSGFINTQPEEGSRVLTSGIDTFGENYQFELSKAA